MKSQLVKTTIAILMAFSIFSIGLIAKEYKSMTRSELHENFNLELRKIKKENGDNDNFREIFYIYKYVKPEWLPDLESYYLKKYSKLRGQIGQQKNDDSLVFMGGIRYYLQFVRSKKFHKLLLEDLPKAKPYVFPEKFMRGGWGEQFGYDQRKGINGQLMSGIVLTDDGSYTKKLVDNLSENKINDINERYLAIWSLGYSTQDFAVSYLKKSLESKDKKEVFLAESALNLSFTFMKEDKKKELGNYLTQKKIRRFVSPKEYHPR